LKGEEDGRSDDSDAVRNASQSKENVRKNLHSTGTSMKEATTKLSRGLRSFREQESTIRSYRIKPVRAKNGGLKH